MTEQKHSPLKWKLRKGFTVTKNVIIDTNEKTVAIITHSPDADLIVKAVNSHQPLIDACKMALEKEKFNSVYHSSAPIPRALIQALADAK